MSMSRPNLIVLIVLGSLAGCAEDPPTVSVDPAGDNPAHFNVSVDRLEREIPRTLEKCYWGLLRQKRRDDGVIEVDALVPNERTAYIVATPVGEGRSEVSIRVGLTGDVSSEQYFLAWLRQTLKLKPRRVRGGKFELPPDF